MRCKRCKMECLESELVDGYCSECRENYKNDVVELHHTKNSVSEGLKVWYIIILIVGVLGTTFCFTFNIAYAIAILCLTLFLATIINGFAEIIQLLEDIKNK